MENIEAAMKRIPPHSIEAEQAVLGAMLMNKDAVMVASEIITERISIRQLMVLYLTVWWISSKRGNRLI